MDCVSRKLSPSVWKKQPTKLTGEADDAGMIVFIAPSKSTHVVNSSPALLGKYDNQFLPEKRVLIVIRIRSEIYRRSVKDFTIVHPQLHP